MHIDIKMEDCNWAYSIEDRLVFCIIPNTERAVLDFFEEEMCWPYPIQVSDAMRMPKHFTGMARCAPGDEWNLEVGKKIAYARAKENYARSFDKHVQAGIKAMEKLMDNWQERSVNYRAKIYKNIERINYV